MPKPQWDEVLSAIVPIAHRERLRSRPQLKSNKVAIASYSQIGSVAKSGEVITTPSHLWPITLLGQRCDG